MYTHATIFDIAPEGMKKVNGQYAVCEYTRKSEAVENDQSLIVPTEKVYHRHRI